MLESLKPDLAIVDIRMPGLTGLEAIELAKAKGLKVIGLTGSRKSKLSKLADVCIRVPETETYKIQEYHLPVYHCLCWMLEEKFFGEK